MAGFCDQRDEPLDFHNEEYLYWLNNYQMLKEDPAPWRQL
jgi:hypothetical protein